MTHKFDYLLRLGDSSLVLSQQLMAWCGHAPALEEDLALSNVALDLLGQARMWLTYAGEVEGAGRDEDALAFHRDGAAFRNVLLVEQPNGDYGDTVMRQFLYDAWHHHALAALCASSDPQIADIASKAAKEVRYHLERSSGLVISLGNGTAESHARMRAALGRLWPFTGEWFISDAVDAACAAERIGSAAPGLAQPWRRTIEAVLRDATLEVPAEPGYQRGGWQGIHGEQLGRLLAEMQSVPRAYPGAVW